jgi:hypothetical protein
MMVCAANKYTLAPCGSAKKEPCSTVMGVGWAEAEVDARAWRLCGPLVRMVSAASMSLVSGPLVGFYVPLTLWRFPNLGSHCNFSIFRDQRSTLTEHGGPVLFVTLPVYLGLGRSSCERVSRGAWSIFRFAISGITTMARIVYHIAIALPPYLVQSLAASDFSVCTL